jgi:HEAT repeat protein
MTPTQRFLISSLLIRPGDERPDRDRFLREIHSPDGSELGLALLEDARVRQDNDDLELAFIVIFTFGVPAQAASTLEALAFDDWHTHHVHVLGALTDLRGLESATGLFRLATYSPPYLDSDDADTLRSDAVWALGKLELLSATAALRELAESEDAKVSSNARRQLARKGIEYL